MAQNSAIDVEIPVAAVAPAVIAGSRPSLGALWQVLAAVPDPEIPAVSIVDLGILRSIEWDRAEPTTLI
jgi:metal-sulfur cluster biosynthetic enzyme